MEAELAWCANLNFSSVSGCSWCLARFLKSKLLLERPGWPGRGTSMVVVGRFSVQSRLTRVCLKRWQADLSVIVAGIGGEVEKT